MGLRPAVTLPTQHVSPGRLEAACRQEFGRLVAASAIEKIWAKQPGLWKPDPDHARIITNRLGWIGVLETMRNEAAALGEFARQIQMAELNDVVLLGMGGSSLAPEVFSLTFPRPANSRRFFVLDSTDPASVLTVEKAVDLRHTLFIVASKSGKTLETLSQFSYFHHRLYLSGIRPQGPSFVAITDHGSYLARLARENRFRHTFLNPGDIGGRYSALSYFGLVPALLWGVDIPAVLDGAMEVRTACEPGAPAETNPALALGALLGAAALHGADKLFLLATPSLVSLGNWIEQLIAESTGKEGKGIVPVAGGGIPTPQTLAEGCLVAALRMEGEDATAFDAAVQSLKSSGMPMVEVRLNAPVELGGEFFKWEVATALAGAVLGIDPFDEPNVQESKDNTARILEEFQSKGKMPLGTPRLTESGIELYAEGPMHTSISALRLSEALRTFLAQRRPGDYLALLAYVERNVGNGRQLDALRAKLNERLNLPVLLGYGPRYMHSIGQLYKGGPATGMFLVITSAKAEDAAIPAAKYTFGQLQMAQALGDLQSLLQRGKSALRLHLARGAGAGLGELLRATDQALATSRPARC